MTSGDGISRLEALQRMAEASDEHDECPECGREFQATDMTKGGDLVFVHDDRDMCSVETEVSGFDV